MRTEISCGLAGALLLLGCKATEKPSGPLPDLGSPPAASVTLLSGPPPSRPPFKDRMKDHTLYGVTMRDAVARGDLQAAKGAALALADLPTESDLPPERRAKLDAMIVAAQRAADAPDLHEAARRLAALAQTCGDCHAAQGGPRLGVQEIPPDLPGVGPRMARHQWAAARLWEGLAAPSEDAWSKGAFVLADAPLEPEKLTPGQSPVPAIGTLATSVHDLGRKAETVPRGAARVELYGEMMATCASCHARLGGGGPPAIEKRR